MSVMSSKSQSTTLNELFFHYQKSYISFNEKRKSEEHQFENSFNEGKSVKKTKLDENENNDYVTEEFELDIDLNTQYNNDENK
ncbi:hypothetical protein C1645_768235 [Glomus cerebriforme]|uniref:Uncharacterized protein n=1 Tax=Glomus cerebriforme TaxID=658196 RepID=A0A397T829_9GLOM|nr:hypothetical protein C1645_768235 [Glomus cerebriforme]